MMNRFPRKTDSHAGVMRRMGLGWLVGVVLAIASPICMADATAAQATQDGAVQHVQDIGDRVVRILQDGSVADDDRVRRLIDALNEATDVDYIAKLVLGHYWRSASEEQRAEYLELFHGLLMGTIAVNISGYEGETFDITRSIPINERDSMVTTSIVTPGGGPPLRVDWRVRSKDEDFKVIDVIVEGISLVVTQRSEFIAVVSRDGMNGLIAQLKRRVENPAYVPLSSRLKS